jgi:hypothetical protein
MANNKSISNSGQKGTYTSRTAGLFYALNEPKSLTLKMEAAYTILYWRVPVSTVSVSAVHCPPPIRKLNKGINSSKFSKCLPSANRP